MASPEILLILAQGFEELEVIGPVDLLRRAGASVTTAALENGIHVTGRNGVTLHADSVLPEQEVPRVQCIIIPGGPAVATLRKDPRVPRLVRELWDSGSIVAAICAAPLVLKDAGLLQGRRHTAQFSTKDELPDALLAERVVEDGPVHILQV
jgi:4-methyl-5(b-hydroxyethyl)-thiazole monophosphate biosynthesis